MDRSAVAAAYDRQADTVYRICYAYMKNAADAEDMVQETFLRLIGHIDRIQNPEHEKAWLIVTASNLCKNQLRYWWRRNTSLDEAMPAKSEPVIDDTCRAVLALPEKYRLALYLYYYEGYTTPEIARMLHRKDATVRSWLHTGRTLLRRQLGESEREDFHE
ncbi:MAG: RNA polymerase sigma factor [Acutalibacteraceae bacterium]